MSDNQQGAVPECVERWREYTDAAQRKAIQLASNNGAYQAAPQCLEWLTTAPAPTIAGVGVPHPRCRYCMHEVPPEEPECVVCSATLEPVAQPWHCQDCIPDPNDEPPTPPDAIALQGEALRAVREWQKYPSMAKTVVRVFRKLAVDNDLPEFQKHYARGLLILQLVSATATLLDALVVVPLLRAALAWLNAEGDSDDEHDAFEAMCEARELLEASPEWKALVSDG